MDSLNDPNVREEVKKMMADPDFRGKIEKLKKDPKFMENMADAKKVMESEAYVEAEPQVPPDYSDQKRNVEVGLKGLGEMSKDPKLLAEAMESLKDPEIAKEVQKMMAGTYFSLHLLFLCLFLLTWLDSGSLYCNVDPEFQAEMKKLTDSPQFKKMQEKSEDVMEGLEQDPVKLKMLQKQMEEMMGKWVNTNILGEMF